MDFVRRHGASCCCARAGDTLIERPGQTGAFMMKTLPTPATVQHGPATRDKKLRWYFPTVSGVVLAAVLVAFSRTFFLRAFFDVPSMPAYLYVHGVVLTAWFVVVFAQTVLVARDRTAEHRRLGVVAAVVGVLVVLISAYVLIRAVPRGFAAGLPIEAIKGVVLGDLVSLVWFSAFVGTGLYLRRRPEIHKRLMIASCFVFSGPVNARLAHLGLGVPQLSLIPLPLFVPAVYDLITLRRLHRGTILVALIFVLTLVVTVPLFVGNAGARLIDLWR
jgi:hypothetical protein